jgi:hypothetical protein
MLSVVMMNSNGSQALLSHDDVVDVLVAYGWDRFIRLLEVFNLKVAQAFSQTFDGTKAKIGDLQMEVTEDFIAEAMGLPQKGARWFKNIKFKGIP